MATQIDIRVNGAQQAVTQVNAVDASVRRLGQSSNLASGQLDGMVRASNAMNRTFVEGSRLLEDATVGYGLNGLAGAIRAGSNNLNQMALAFGPWALAATTALTVGTQLYLMYQDSNEVAEKGTENEEKWTKAIRERARAYGELISAQRDANRLETVKSARSELGNQGADLATVEGQIKQSDKALSDAKKQRSDLQFEIDDAEALLRRIRRGAMPGLTTVAATNLARETESSLKQLRSQTLELDGQISAEESFLADKTKEREETLRRIKLIKERMPELAKKEAEQEAKKAKEEADRESKLRNQAKAQLDSRLRIDTAADPRQQQIEEERQERIKHIRELKLTNEEQARMIQSVEDAALAKRQQLFDAEAERQQRLDDAERAKRADFVARQLREEERIQNQHTSTLARVLGVGTEQDQVKKSLAGISDREAAGFLGKKARDEALAGGASQREALAAGRRAMAEAMNPEIARRRQLLEAAAAGDAAANQAAGWGYSNGGQVAAGARRRAFQEVMNRQGGSPLDKAREQILQNQVGQMENQQVIGEQTANSLRSIIEEQSRLAEEQQRLMREMNAINAATGQRKAKINSSGN